MMTETGHIKLNNFFIIVLRTPFIEESMVVVHSSFGKVTTENREKDSGTNEIDSVQTVQTSLMSTWFI